MAEADELFILRNLFALGAYQSLINEVASSIRSNTLSDQGRLEAQSFLYRAQIAQGKYENVLRDIRADAPPELQSIKLLAKYLSARGKGDKQGMDKSREDVGEMARESMSPIVLVVAATTYVCDGLVEEALKFVVKCPRNLECAAFRVQIYLHIDRLDLARKEISLVKTWAEDATLAQLMEAWVDLRSGGDRYQEAFYIFEEFGQSVSSHTLKVLNGQAVCNIALGRYPEAESVLLEALQKDSDDPETLVNLIACSTLAAKPAEVINRYMTQLREVAPSHPFLLDLDQKEAAFDRAAQRYGIA
ncbi:uncharacterized protein VTP21DRAFT_7628 [Calcarisporiella thermophila]|uniref:uncharacterized protein n=1 Tax=Calcarisporiella thermophila TaxID=911321 RepID=UPI003741F300